ncbi:MAG TPA: hypothetical protein VFB42_04755 [Gaiellaceae bacterium]|nr:hypothetical protein [Gaiellaceae bacterium]
MARTRSLAPAALAVAAALAAAAAAAAPPTKPLSSLGRLRPAPPPGELGPELVPVPDAPALAPAASKATPSSGVGGIRCERNERLAFHVHAHVAVFVNGRPRALPAGIGVWPALPEAVVRTGTFGLTPEACLSWLTTHFADGIVHVEAPVRRAFVLGELFDVWGQPLSRTRVGPARGPVVAIVNGGVWTGDPRRIPLASHAQIQLEVGRPLVAYQPVEFPGTY